MTQDSDAAPATLDFTFAPALSAAGVAYEAMTLREPLMGEVLKAADQGALLAQMQALISAIGGPPKAAINTMPLSQYRRAERYFMDFLTEDQEEEVAPTDTGATLTLDFAEPIKVGETERERIVITEPTFSMLQLSSKAGSLLAQQISLMALASMPSGGSEALIAKMRFSDFARGRRFLEGFSAAGATNT